MAKKIVVKTTKKMLSVAQSISKIKDPVTKANCKKLLGVFKAATKTKPKLWGTSIIGFGEYTYFRSNGDYGVSLATGFSIGNSGPTIYITPGFEKYAPILKKLGPHKTAKSCLYLKDFENVDLAALKKLISLALRDLKRTNEVRMK